MADYATLLALCALPAAGNISGGLLAELFPVSRAWVGIALHAAAGVILAVVSLELLPEAVHGALPWLPILSFVAGGVFFVASDAALGMVRSRIAGGNSRGGPWLIFLGVALDLFSDGVMIGAGSTVSFDLAVLLAIGQVTADLPEGFATVAALRGAGVPGRTRLLASLSFALPIVIGATAGHLFLREAPRVYTFAVLGFTAGALTTLVVEEMVPEAHEGGESRWAAIAFLGGFAGFALVSAYM